MKPRLSLAAGLITLPLVLGLVSGAFLQAGIVQNPFYEVIFRVDLGTAIAVAGSFFTVVGFAFWMVYRRIERRDRNRLETAEREADLKRRRFIRRLDHELKNPLTALRMEIAYLAESGNRSDQVFTDMQTQFDRITHLLADLRKLAQLEEVVVEKTPLAIDEVLREVLEAAQDHPGHAGKDVHLTVLSHPLPLAEISGDRGLLWLACFNLLDNALKFTPQGSQVELRAFEVAPWLVMEVADDGPGIPEGDQEMIFEELYRGQNAHGLPGSGLGLALVRTIAGLHGGTVSFRSRPGKGTIFTLRLPLSPSN